MFIVFNCLFALFNELSLMITNNQANDIFKETRKYFLASLFLYKIKCPDNISPLILNFYNINYYSGKLQMSLYVFNRKKTIFVYLFFLNLKSGDNIMDMLKRLIFQKYI